MRTIHHRIGIYALSIVLTFGVLYGAGLGVYYIYAHEKLEDYASPFWHAAIALSHK